MFFKVFQCLLIEGENCGQEALRDAEKFVISDDDFTRFVQRHSTLSCLVPESNEKVRVNFLLVHVALNARINRIEKLSEKMTKAR